MSLMDRGPRGNVQNPFTTVDVGSIAYSNPRITTAFNGNLEGALNYILDAIYPNYKGTVNTPADLPVTAQANDFYVVLDDGDGHSAGYVYSVISGVTAWVKRYDVDWSYDQILADTITRTSYMYAAKYGVTDRDVNGDPITGTFAGQHIYGGDQANQNMTLTANATDGTGFVQTTTTFRPSDDNQFDLGTSANRWTNIYVGQAVILGMGSTQYSEAGIYQNASAFNIYSLGLQVQSFVNIDGLLNIQPGSITDASGSLSFGNNNLSTTGTLTAAANSQLADITFTNGTFNTASSSFSFSNKDVAGIGNLTSSKVTTDEVDVANLLLSGQTLKTNAPGTALILQAGSGGNSTTVQINSALQTNFDVAISGKLAVSGSALSQFTGAVQIGTALKLSTTTSKAKLESLSGEIILSAFNGVIIAGGDIVPEVGNRSIGAASNRYGSLYFDNVNDGTNAVSTSVLTSLRSINTGVASGMSIFWDGTKWVPSLPDTEIVHNTLSGLTTGDAGHTQFVMLAGRSGGQLVSGGTAASENLTLDSTSSATKGFVLVSSALAPTSDAVYSSGWTGTNLGGASRNFNNMYSKGIHFGLRFDQYAGSGAYPASSGQNVGRVIWDTTINQLLVDSGTAWSKVGQQKWSADTTWNGTDQTKVIDVSSIISDARSAIWQFCDNANAFERMGVKITTSQTQVTITVAPALPAGSYRLIGLN